MITTLPPGTEAQRMTTALHGELQGLDFVLPPELEASEPPEARGLARDAVRLLVSYASDDRMVHTTFRELPRFLEAGDVVVINTSGTLNAAINGSRADGTAVELHLSTELPAGLWIVEVRLRTAEASAPFYDAMAGETLTLDGGGRAVLLAPYRSGTDEALPAKPRLWIASLALPAPLNAYLERHGFPIRYRYVKQGWPSSYYQTVYATEMGSAEMPSAGRAFSPELLTRLVAKGIQIVPLVLHTGVASLEDHEPPYEERFHVPLATARAVTSARTEGRRVVAVGTTVVRALETVTDAAGTTHPGAGWTREIITPQRGLRAVTGLLTGFHEPRATHLAMLETLVGRRHLRAAYAAALRERYLWHEFGDLHLLLP